MNKLVQYDSSDSDEIDDAVEYAGKISPSPLTGASSGENDDGNSAGLKHSDRLESDSKQDSIHDSQREEPSQAEETVTVGDKSGDKHKPGRLTIESEAGTSIDMVSTATEDFFGLHDQGDRDSKGDGESEIWGKEQKIHKHFPSQCKNKNRIEDFQLSAIPNSSFWNNPGTGDNWSNPVEVWGKTDNSSAPVTHFATEWGTSVECDTASRDFGYQSKAKQRRIEPRTDVIPKVEAKPVVKCPFYVHHKITPYLHTSKASPCRLPHTKVTELSPGHAGIVNRIQWNVAQFSHLLCSSSVDRTVKVWNVFSSLQNYCVQAFTFHEKAVKDVTWAPSGKEILSCSYDKTARLADVNTGKEIFKCEHSDFVTCIQFHPVNRNWFVSGSLNALYAWDCRNTSKFFRKYIYKEPFGQVKAMAFLPEGNQFFTCNDLVARDSADKNIMAWDFNKAVVLSNQIYQERYTCTSLRIHPYHKELLAQTQGDYMAQFSCIPPYKMNKCKRFEGHRVSGYNIGCDFSGDGKYVVSGSADGHLYCYDWQQSRLLKKLRFDKGCQVCLDVAWHPLLPSTIAAADTRGVIAVFQ